MRCMRSAVTVACVQAEPVILDRDATIEKLAAIAGEASDNGAKLLVFPEAFIPAYPSSVWARALAGWAEPGIEIYLASPADDGDSWQSTLIHIAREARAFVISPSHFQRASSYPADFPLRKLLGESGTDVIGRGGSAILAPDGSYLAGPLYDQEGILYAELEPARLDEERQRFDPAGHYHRPDVLSLQVRSNGRPV